MAFGGISVWQLVIILIVFLLTLIAAPLLHAHRSRNADDPKGENVSDEQQNESDSESRGD